MPLGEQPEERTSLRGLLGGVVPAAMRGGEVRRAGVGGGKEVSGA